jgi:hypothetical protein
MSGIFSMETIRLSKENGMVNALSSIRYVLSGTPVRWRILVDTLSDEQIRRPAAPGEWSAYSCLKHLCDTERDVFQNRVRAFLAGQDLMSYDPSRQGASDVDESASRLADEFARLRAESLVMIDDLALSDLARTVNHEEYGPVRLPEMLHYWPTHDLMHTIQAERALMQPLIVDCGPWQVMTRDYVLGGEPQP